ncbi:MAG TPA: tRNA adenosine(34) deaminase TadA [Terriglobia bacterium]|nr:tRNA adenosine(34) deaminase TadA [Terriglobia bacterium]
MRLALEQARRAGAEGEVPVGAVVVWKEEVIGQGGNRSIRDRDPTAHAEVVALRQAAARLGNYRLTGAALYVTVEPCVMCAGAALLARLERIVYGCDDPKAGAIRSLYQIASDPRLNHQIAVAPGVLAAECSALLRNFFAHKREKP